MIRAVLFDLDGVLIDAREWHYEALNRALGHFGYSIERYDHLVTFDGLPTRKKLDLLSLEKGLPRALHGLVNDLKQKFTHELIFSRCRPTHRHRLALAKLRERGLRLAVCSNSIRRTVTLMLERAAILAQFEFVLSNEDVARPKPDPEMYVTAMTRMGLRPEECLIIEDNPHGVEAAARSGGHVLQVAGPHEVELERIARRIDQIDGRVTA